MRRYRVILGVSTLILSLTPMFALFAGLIPIGDPAYSASDFAKVGMICWISVVATVASIKFMDRRDA